MAYDCFAYDCQFSCWRQTRSSWYTFSANCNRSIKQCGVKCFPCLLNGTFALSTYGRAYISCCHRFQKELLTALGAGEWWIIDTPDASKRLLVFAHVFFDESKKRSNAAFAWFCDVSLKRRVYIYVIEPSQKSSFYWTLWSLKSEVHSLKSFDWQKQSWTKSGSQTYMTGNYEHYV